MTKNKPKGTRKQLNEAAKRMQELSAPVALEPNNPEGHPIVQQLVGLLRKRSKKFVCKRHWTEKILLTQGS
jgi:hypothetical protein